MAAKENLPPESYARQISGLQPWEPKGKKAFDAKLNVNLYKEDMARLKEIEGWPDKLREAILKLIAENATNETNTSAA